MRKKEVYERCVALSRLFLIHRSPNTNCNLLVSFKEKCGYQNPYVHLRSCFGKGKPQSEKNELFREMYEAEKKKPPQQGYVPDKDFKMSSVSEYEVTLYRSVRYIVMRSKPISAVEDYETRLFCGSDINICTNTLRGTLIQLVQIVERRIKTEIDCKKRALMSDGWTCHGVHFVAIMLVYSHVVYVRRDGATREEHVTKQTLIPSRPWLKSPLTTLMIPRC